MKTPHFFLMFSPPIDSLAKPSYELSKNNEKNSEKK
jgi:hypothetical protein